MIFIITSIKFVTEVGSIDILNNTNVNTSFVIDQKYYYKLQFRRKDKEILANTEISVDLQVLHYPSHLVCYGTFNPMGVKDITFDYEQLNSTTNENGEMTVR